MYVVYTSLRATYGCNGGPIQTFGSAYERKTIGYSSKFLAYGTLSSPDQRCDENVVVGGFHTIDFTDLYYHPITTSVTSKAGCPPYINPRLSMPAELTDVDAAWKTCQPLFYGAFDPPRILTSVKGPLSPLPTHDSPESNPASTMTNPATTTSHEITPIPVSAIQGSHALAMPTPTSDATPSIPADKQDPKEDGDPPQGLASHIIFGFLGPKSSDISTNPHDNGNTDGSAPTDGKSPSSSTLNTASITTSTPLATGILSASPTQQAVVDLGSGFAPEPQVEDGGTSDFVGTSKLDIGKTTGTIVHPTESPIETTLFMSIIQVHTLAVDATMTIAGSPTTNTGPSAVTLSEVTSVATATAFATYSLIEDPPEDVGPVVYSINVETKTFQPHESFTKSGDILVNTAPTAVVGLQTSSIPLAYSSLEDARQSLNRVLYSIDVVTKTLQPNQAATINGVLSTNAASTAIVVIQTTTTPLAYASLRDSEQNGDRVIYSIDVVTNTLLPNQVATNNGRLFTNTASTAMVVTQTSSIPLVTIDKPTPKVLSTLYESSLLTTSVSPGAVFTFSGSRTTNTATSALVLTSVIQVPISTASVFPADNSRNGVISNVNGQPATQTMGIDDPSETYTVTGARGEHVTLVFVDGKNRSTVTSVTTDHANFNSQSTARIPSSHLEESSITNLSTTAAFAGESRSTTVLDANTQSQGPDNTNGARRRFANGRLALIVASITLAFG